MKNTTEVNGMVRYNNYVSRSFPLTLAFSALLGLAVAAQAAGETETEKKTTETEKKTTESENSGTVSSVQSTARPFGLDIVNKVMVAGSDTKSADFQKNVLPGALSYIKTTLPERVNNSKVASTLSLDWSRLKLQSDYNVRAYFVSEGAGNLNTLGFNTEGSGVKTGDPKLIFPNASSTLGGIHTGTAGTRTPGEPVLPGDFVNMGKLERGTMLDFFLIANGANGGKDVFTTSGTGNPDGLNHIASFTPRIFAVPQLNSPYIFISFEDLKGGGDNDYNDTVFAIDVGRATVSYLLGAPEPSLCLTLGGFLALAFWAKRRMNQGQPTLAPCRA